jgi:hypothetical protein
MTINDRATGILRMKIIKAKESELVKQAGIIRELEALFVYNNIRQWKRICNASRNRYSIRS